MLGPWRVKVGNLSGETCVKLLLAVQRRWDVISEHVCAPSTRVFRTVPVSSSPQSSSRFNRSALVTTDTELKVIAAAAIMGLSRMPKNGYRSPAAIGTPRLL